MRKYPPVSLNMNINLVGNLPGILYRFGILGKQTLHLIWCLKIKARGVKHGKWSVFFEYRPLCLNAKHNLLRIRIICCKVMDIIRRNDRNTEFSRQSNELFPKFVHAVYVFMVL